MGKKTIKFNERENSSPDTFRDLSSIEDYFESMSNEMNFDYDVENTSALDSLMETMPEKCREDLKGNDTTKMTRLEQLHQFDESFTKQYEGKRNEMPYQPEFQFYLDDLNRMHFRDTILGDMIVDPKIPLNKINEDIDSSTMCDLLDSIYLDLITTRTPLVILNSEDCEKIMKDKGIFGVGRNQFKHAFILTDYSVKIQDMPIPNYLILGFSTNESARESFIECIDKWMNDGFTNAEIAYILLNLVHTARENAFISSIDDDDYKFICEKYEKNNDSFFNAISEIVKQNDTDENADNLLASTFNIYDDIRGYASDEEDEEQTKEGGASNDEEPFLDDAREQQESSEGKRCDDNAQQEDGQKEEQKEITEEVETEVEEDELNLPEEDEEIDSIEIEEAEEDDMVIQVRRDDY